MMKKHSPNAKKAGTPEGGRLAGGIFRTSLGGDTDLVKPTKIKPPPHG